MKPGLALLALAGAVVLGCEPNAFNVELKGETTVQASPLGILSAFPAIGSFTNLDFSQAQDFKNEGISKSQIQSVRVQSVKLRITQPDTQDFTFLDTVQLYARAGDNEVGVASRQELATHSPPAPDPTISLDVPSQELKSYVAAPTMSLILRGTGRAPAQDTTLQATVVFRVAANVSLSQANAPHP